MIVHRRSPRTLRSVLMVVTDDLLIGERKGFPIEDCSRLTSDPARLFDLKVILLYVQGDYPAQRLACGFAHAGGCACHYCLDRSKFSSGVSRNVYGEYYRWLPPNDPERPAGASGTTEPPQPRTHVASCMDALQNEFAMTTKLQAAAKKGPIKDVTRNNIAKLNIKGVNWWCPLSALHLFDSVWDFVYDIMHALDVFKRHIVPSMKGERQPKASYVETEGNYDDEEKARRKALNALARKEFTKASEVIVN